MRQIIPSRHAVLVLAAAATVCAIALAMGAALADVTLAAVVALGVGIGWVAVDVWRTLDAWHHHPLHTVRALPDALALGVPRAMTLTLVNDGPLPWVVDLFDEVDPCLLYTSPSPRD